MPRITANEREATRIRLIEAAKREFGARGLAGARFDEISVAAGCAKGTIYNYFENKEALFFTIVEEWCGLLVDAVAVQGDECSAQAQLSEIARIDVEIAKKDPDLARVVIQHMPALSNSYAVAAQQAIAPGVDVLTAIIRVGLASGELASELSADALAQLFLATLSAFEQQALSGEPRIRFDQIVALFERHFLDGLLCSGAPK